jgi:murein DD-endopeptidase MepM/ murein hydrolase activator NlpD
VWTQTLSLGPHGSHLTVDLGDEPAIEADGERHTFFDHRRVSLRWFFGTILTGLMGAALIGATIYAALDHEANFAEAPLPAQPVKKDVSEAGLNPHKGDRLVKPVDIVAAKQTYRVALPTKVGDKEVMRTHTFDRVETTLLTTTAGFADEVPVFNPLKVLADARAPVEVAPEVDSPQDDAEFSWVTRDFAPANLTSNVSLSMDEVQAQVTEHMKSSLTAGSNPFGLQAQMLLMRTSHAVGALPYGDPNDGIGASPFSSIEVRILPENVTVVPRSPIPPGGLQTNEKLVTVHHGEAFENLMVNAGVPRETIFQLVNMLQPSNAQQVVPDGRRIKLVFTDLSNDQRALARLLVYDGERLETTIALKDDGGYVRLSNQDLPDRTASQSNDNDDDPSRMRLYNALYETALKQEIPRPIIDDLVRIFANDVDFQRSVTNGDTFEAFYDRGDEGENSNQLLFASITARGETYRYYRFQTPDDSVVDYYDQNGRSTRKFLVRAPILNFKITSGFGYRFHPILGYTRPHTGVDFAAPIGTPIFAAGNGTILQAGWSSGYGRRIEIQHANGYVTTYNHLSGFARGVIQGARVRQGQVIGYLGQTGLATGPHLHYEVLVNGHFVDPMKVKLARTREFDGHMLALFKKERDRIDDLLARAPNAQAQVTAQK